MNKRMIAFVLILVVLFGLATYEVVAVDNIIRTLDSDVARLETLFDENEDNVLSIIPEITNIKNYWDSLESPLSLMFNHKDLSTITDTLSRMLGYATLNNYEDAYLEMRLLKEYSEKNRSIMGFNYQNVL